MAPLFRQKIVVYKDQAPSSGLILFEAIQPKPQKLDSIFCVLLHRWGKSCITFVELSVWILHKQTAPTSLGEIKVGVFICIWITIIKAGWSWNDYASVDILWVLFKIWAHLCWPALVHGWFMANVESKAWIW